MDSHGGQILSEWNGLERLEANGQGGPHEEREQAPPRWSVVIITRNEEANTEPCLRSVLEAFQGCDVEIVLVDSASTDRTVNIARRFPVKVVCLPPSKHLNPAIGRSTGFTHTSGRYVLFLDGDCILSRDWVPLAERALDDDPGLGGVAGALFDRARQCPTGKNHRLERSHGSVRD